MSQDEFKSILSDARVKMWLQAMELNIRDPMRFFAMLDVEGDGVLNAEELISGMAVLKGPSTQLHMEMTERVILRHLRDIETVMQTVQNIEAKQHLLREDLQRMVSGEQEQEASALQVEVRDSWWENHPDIPAQKLNTDIGPQQADSVLVDERSDFARSVSSASSETRDRNAAWWNSRISSAGIGGHQIVELLAALRTESREYRTQDVPAGSSAASGPQQGESATSEDGDCRDDHEWRV